MRPQLKLAAALLLSTLNPPPSTVFAQGSLTPPGAPAPTMKTLAQIEPRTPISSAPFTITNAGSYYLTTNLTVASGDAITIAINGVTLDLNGFSVSSTAASANGCGILINAGLSDLTILKGHIRGSVTNNGSGVYTGPGFQNGIYYSVLPAPVNTRVSGVSVAGCLGYGIFLGNGDSTVVDFCTVRTVGGSGIVASTVKGSVVLNCGGSDAILCVNASDSHGECTGSGSGFDAYTAQNCYGYSSSGIGLTANTAQGCLGFSTNTYSSHGLNATTANNCMGYNGSSGYGLTADTAQNCYGYSSSGVGLSAAYVAEGCHGSSGGSGYGLYASKTALNCCGSSSSGYGLYAASVAQNCYGSSSTGTGLYAADLAIGCAGSSSSGTGVSTYIANSCRVAGGTTNITYKYNMP
jgi:hypothetical protein